MAISQLTPQCRLQGISVFLSASVPSPQRRDEYERIPEAPLRIEEAVVCIARAVFMEGGTLVFGAHPSISPLVARLVDHYYLPAPAEELRRERAHEERELHWRNPSLVIYQSRVWREHWAEATDQLTRHPLVRVEWTDAAPGETVDPQLKNRPQAPRSMEIMRKAMIEQTSPVAMITIGGMKGVLEEARLFADLRPGKPIFTLATTGGAAALLPKQGLYQECIRVMDDEAESLVRKFWQQSDDRTEREPLDRENRRKFYVPYAFVAQQIVAQIVENFGEASR